MKWGPLNLTGSPSSCMDPSLLPKSWTQQVEGTWGQIPNGMKRGHQKWSPDPSVSGIRVHTPWRHRKVMHRPWIGPWNPTGQVRKLKGCGSWAEEPRGAAFPQSGWPEMSAFKGLSSLIPWPS